MFVGEFPAKLENKRRLYMPKKMREQLGKEKIVFTRGYENCIFGWQLGDWEKSNQANLERPITDQQARNIRRYLFSGAEVCELDSLGRVILPENLYLYGGLDAEAVVIGAGDHFEIWNKHAWNDPQDANQYDA